MAMTDKEQSFLEYLISRGDNCVENMFNVLEFLIDEKDTERKTDLIFKLNYYRGCLDTYTDLIAAYRHNFGDK